MAVELSGGGSEVERGQAGGGAGHHNVRRAFVDPCRDTSWPGRRRQRNGGGVQWKWSEVVMGLSGSGVESR